MDAHVIGWLFFGVYIAFMAYATYLGLKQSKGLASFSVGNRQINPIWVGLSLAANLTSAATFVINPGLVYHFGLAGFFGYAVATPLGIMVGLIIVSKSFRRVGDQFAVLTVPQWIGDRFGDKRLTLFYAFLSLLLITFLVLITVGLARVLGALLGIDLLVAIAIVIVLPLVAIFLGGAGAHILINSVQALIMLLVALILLGSGLSYFSEGIGGFLGKLSAIDPLLAQPINPKSALFRNFFEVYVANFVIGIAVIMQPHIISKALYLKTEGDVNKYLTTGLVTVFFFFMVLIVGAFARIQFNDPSLAVDAVMPKYLTDHFGPIVRGIVALGLLSAGFSTMEGLLVSLSAIFANDVYKNLFTKPDEPGEDVDQKALRYGKGFLLVLAPVLFLISASQIKPDLSVAMLAQNGVYGLFSATFAPVLFGIFSKRLTKGGVLASALTAIVIHFGMTYGKVTFMANNPAVPATFAIVGSFLVATLFTILNRKPTSQA